MESNEKARCAVDSEVPSTPSDRKAVLRPLRTILAQLSYLHNSYTPRANTCAILLLSLEMYVMGRCCQRGGAALLRMHGWWPGDEQIPGGWQPTPCQRMAPR